MFTSEISLLSSTYQSLCKTYPKDIESLNTESLESLILRIVIYVSDNEEINIQDYLNVIENKHSWLFITNLLAREVIRELGLGKGTTSTDAQLLPINTKKQLCFEEVQHLEERIDFSKIIQKHSLKGKLPSNIDCYNGLYLKNPVFAIYSKSYLTKLMSLEGQFWISTTPYAHLLSTLVQIINFLVEDQSFDESYKYLIKARLAFQHNLILDKPVSCLVENYLTNYKKYIQSLIKTKQISATHYINFQMQYFNALLFAYKYTQAQAILQQSKKVLNMQIQFTGKLGRRTKFQQFDTVQLVMNITQFKEKQKINVQDIPEEQLKIIPAQQLLQLDNKNKQQPSTIKLQEDSILFQKPKLNQEEEKLKIDSLKQLVLVNIIYYMYETTPRDEILFLRISSMIAPLLQEKQISYSVKIALLSLRSLNELPRYKNSDRALQQLQQLVNEYHQTKDYDNADVLATPSGYRIHLTFLKLVGEKVMGFGLMMTGVEMYQKAGLYEQCVQGLLSAGHKTKALQLANKLLTEQGNDPSPYLLCLMGDGTGNLQYYQRSWKQSKNTFSRAMRTLGRTYFMKKDFEKAVQCYKKALDVSFYNPADWFTLGCVYINLNQYSDGAKAFSQSVSIDDSQGEGWGNLASCFIGLKKYNQAYGALAQALKYSQSSWKLWQNMMGVSLRIKKFYKFMQSINRLITINASKVITQDILQKLNQVLEYRTTLLRVQRKRITFTYKNKIEQQYAHIKQKMGEKSYVWRQYANYLSNTIPYLKQLQKVYLQLHENGQVDINDMIPGYEDAAIIPEFTIETIKQIKLQIIQAKQKQLNMTMQLGWESNKQKREQVKKILNEYKQCYLQVHKQGDEDFNVFVNSIDVNIKVAESK